jgi:hypothetical protein
MATKKFGLNWKSAKNGFIIHFILGADVKVTFKEWGEKIQANFEEQFWINSTPMPDREPHPELIHKR